MLKIFTACLAHETNTFVTRPTTLGDFEAEGIRRHAEDKADPGLVMKMIGAMREAAAVEGHRLVEGLAAVAAPGGPVERATHESLRDELLAGLAAALPVDGVTLILHGSMVAEGCEDCEGDLLERMRGLVGEAMPIVVVLDPHCSLSEKMRRHATALVAFKHYPHTDTAERAREAWRLTVDTALGRIRPASASVDCRIVGLWPTTSEPMQSFIQRMKDLEQGDVLSVSFAHGFPWSDVPEGGARVWVTTDGNEALGNRLAAELADEVWAMRESSSGHRTPMHDAIRRIEQHAIGQPLVLADAADNPGGGAAGDSSFILRALIDKGLTGCAVAGIVDPRAVRRCEQAGLDSTLLLDIGSPPMAVEAKVMALRSDHWQTAFGSPMALGASAWLRTAGGIDIVLISQRQQVLGTDLLSGMGLDWTSLRAVVVKSAQHFHAAFAPQAAAVIYVDTPGLLSTDFARLPYRKRSLDYWPRVDLASWK